jgi:FkbM family methyltransferase
MLNTMTTAPPATAAPATITWDIKFGETSRRFSLFDTPLGKAVCHEVFRGKSYPLMQFNGEVQTVVDIGANIGAAAVYFSVYYPSARIFAFEPTPTNHALLAANTADLSQVKTFPFGLFDRDRQATLYHGMQDSVQNSIGRGGEQTQESETIVLRETAAVFRELALETIDILKLDTEGCEVPILLSMWKWIPRTGVIYVEFHSEIDRLEIDRLLSPTHYLYSGEINRLCRGELRYIAKNRLPPNHERAMGIYL